jgi:dienelactone hydrolase
MARRLRFINDHNLLVQFGSAWRILHWPSLEELENGRGRLDVERASGRRLLRTDDGQWLVDGDAVTTPDDEEISEVAWAGPENLFVVTGAAPLPPPASRIPTPDQGTTAHVFGSDEERRQTLWRISLDGSHPEELMKAGSRETLSDPRVGRQGEVYCQMDKKPIPGFEPGRLRVHRISPSGEVEDAYPHLMGATRLIASPTNGGEQLVAHSSITSYFPNWWVICRTDGSKVPLPQGEQRTDLMTWNTAGTTLAVPIQVGLNSQLVLVDFPSLHTRPLDVPEGDILDVALNDDAVALIGVDITRRVSLITVTSDGAGEKLNLAPEPHPEIDISLWSWKSTGSRMEGVLARPPNVERPLPLVVDLHGGPSPGITAGHLGEAEKWVPEGYVAFMPEFRASGILGAESMMAMNYGVPDAAGGTDVEDVLSGIRSLIEAGIAQRDQIFLFGHSYGANLACQVLAESDLIRAAVAWEGPCDWRLDYLLRGGNPITSELYGGAPWEADEPYQRTSILEQAGSIGTPLLLIYGDEYPYEGIALYTALRGRKKEVELVIYGDEGHTMARPENYRDVMSRTLAWFGTHR